MARRRKRTYRKRPPYTDKTRRDQKSFVSILILGVVLFLIGNILGNTVPPKEANETSPAPKSSERQSVPTRIKISKIALDTSIDPGGITNGDWILSERSAHYLPTSGMPGEGFNTIIYAHRLPNLFARLYELQVGDIITLEDSESRTWYYRVYSIESIDPREIKKLRSPLPNILTLFTCDGWYDQQRLLVRARINLPQENAFSEINPLWFRELIQ